MDIGHIEASEKLEPTPHHCWLTLAIWIHYSVTHTHILLTLAWCRYQTVPQCPNMSRKHLTTWLCGIAEIPIILWLEGQGVNLPSCWADPISFKQLLVRRLHQKSHTVFCTASRLAYNYICNVNPARGKEPVCLKIKHSAMSMRSGCLNMEGWRSGLLPLIVKAVADLQYSNQGTAGCRKTATPHLVHYKMTQPICTSACCNLPNLPWQKHLD